MSTTCMYAGRVGPHGLEAPLPCRCALNTASFACSCYISCFISSDSRKCPRLVLESERWCALSTVRPSIRLMIAPGVDLDLSHVEFSCLPSGLHLVEEDVV